MVLKDYAIKTSIINWKEFLHDPIIGVWLLSNA